MARAQPEPPLPHDLAELMESGVSILVGTRNAALRPSSMRAMGARVDAERRRVTIFVPAATCEAMLSNLADNGRIAVTFSRPIDHRSIQIKGTTIDVRQADAADRAVMEGYRRSFIEGLSFIGLPRPLLERVTYWPSQAVEIAIEELYEQTPGPHAGSPLAS